MQIDQIPFVINTLSSEKVYLERGDFMKETNIMIHELTIEIVYETSLQEGEQGQMF